MDSNQHQGSFAALPLSKTRSSAVELFSHIRHYRSSRAGSPARLPSRSCSPETVSLSRCYAGRDLHPTCPYRFRTPPLSKKGGHLLVCLCKRLPIPPPHKNSLSLFPSWVVRLERVLSHLIDEHRRKSAVTDESCQFIFTF